MNADQRQDVDREQRRLRINADRREHPLIQRWQNFVSGGTVAKVARLTYPHDFWQI